MGTAFTIDSPIKLAPLGIASVMSINDDSLCETMRQVWCKRYHYDYTPIKKSEPDYRAKRITAYLDLVYDIVQLKVDALKNSPFEPGSSITQYFEQLHHTHPLKIMYDTMIASQSASYKTQLQTLLRTRIMPGSIDVNIMTKLDRDTYDKSGQKLPDQYADAVAALRGYANSKLDNSAIIFSAGFNRRLFAYLEQCDDFYPDDNNQVKKRIILKVSDFRSAQTQGVFLAKKGLWLHENRIESGLNCGGHAFATQGLIMGPILEDFKQNREALASKLFALCNTALAAKQRCVYTQRPPFRVTFQGGIGTAVEDQFLLNYYDLDGTGWATPFLLVPEATTVDTHTRHQLARSKPADLYLSDISPLGVPFNTMKNTKSDQEKWDRVAAGKPGSPCPKGYLVSNTEFTKVPICTASRTYQRLKLASLNENEVSDALKNQIYNKACLCEDLAAPALIESDTDTVLKKASAVCPGPNIAYFDQVFSLQAMIDHIYGRVSLHNDTLKRCNLFINEAQMYLDYFKKQLDSGIQTLASQRKKYLSEFKTNLNSGLTYYMNLIKTMPKTMTSPLSADDVTRLNALQTELNQCH
mgnify:CR=1 FL=1